MEYVLGLDLGTASLGWAILECKKTNGEWIPFKIERTGVRIFEAGVEGDVEQGKDASRAAARREARQPRRQNWRTQYRKKKLFKLLQKLDLLPASEAANSSSRKALFDQLDKQLTQKHIADGDHQAHQHLPYYLRTLAAKQPLERYELGRALYSLAQRRGFLSNRKTDTDEKEDGVVKGAISELEEQMKGRTLAETFVQDVDPANADPENRRIRRRYTARKMFHDEFQKIKAVQQPELNLSDRDWNEIDKAIFFQRPLKSQRHRIGRCEIDGQRRCLDALDVFQQFRIWNNVQNLRIADAWAFERGERLSLDEQKTLVVALQDKPKLTWNAARKLLKLPEEAKFSIEEWNKKGLIGHKSNAELIDVFGDRWLEMPVEERDTIVKEIVYFRKPSAMKKRGEKSWGLEKEQADLLTSLRLSEGHARHSETTLNIFVDRMSRGEDYSIIRKDLTGVDESEPLEFLPPINQCGLDITNPAVIRALTELRKVVNELIRQYGKKPIAIRVEMARSLKNSRDVRKRLHKNNENRRERREKAVEGILKELNGKRYSGADIEKWLLAEECNWECPYTGKVITPTKLIGPTPQFDIEHIFPRRYLDNSFTNKTLCDAKFNREVKGDSTAFDACSGRNDWDEIVARVCRFQGPVASLKRKRFMTPASKIPDDFTQKHLNDTRYNAVVARKYLAMLYGGFSDKDGNQRVFAVTGGHTAILRRQWHLNSLLGETEEKERTDHRHHAIDAVVIALTDMKRIKLLVDSAKLAKKTGSPRFYESVQDPWVRFKQEVANSIDDIIVSHRPTRTLPGNLHAESLYSKPHTDADGNVHHRIRKSITKLTAAELKNEKIVDPKIRQLVIEKLAELGESNPQKAFAEETNHPHLTTHDGRKIPIHKVRVEFDKKPRPVGQGVRQRYVGSAKDSNFASMIYAVIDDDGNETKWEHKVIDRLTAHERKSRNQKRKGEKILFPDPTDFDDDKKREFKFALCKNDTVILEGPDGTDVIYRVQKLSQGEIQLCPLATPSIRAKARDRWNQIQSIDNLRKWNLRKISVSPAGIIL